MRTDGKTDRHDESFRNIANAPNKTLNDGKYVFGTHISYLGVPWG